MGLQYGKQVINGINIYQLIYINVLVPVMSHSVDPKGFTSISSLSRI